jgi:hypothetical protein
MPLQATSGAASYDAFGGGAAAVPNYIEECFSTTLYTGNGSTQTITNGIDLAGKGGLVWIKDRTGAFSHNLADTVRGANQYLFTDSTQAQFDAGTARISSFNTNGFSLGSGSNGTNANGNNFASWTFREQPKFFDVVTWTGDGGFTKTVAHSLASVPGFVTIKATSTTGNWQTLARNSSTTYASLQLNSTVANTGDITITDAASSTVLNVGYLAAALGGTNTNGVTYVAYLFAHNAGGFGLTGTDNVISCGSYTGTAGVTTVNVGFEPQWLLIKKTNAAAAWKIVDNMRGFTAGPESTGIYSSVLSPNTADAEAANSTLYTTSTGFNVGNYSSEGGAGNTFIYIAIRRGPMRVPTTGTSVFTPYEVPGSPTTGAITGFVTDAGFIGQRAGSDKFAWGARLMGNPTLNSTNSSAESANTNQIWDRMNGWWNSAINGYMTWGFRRAPGYFDVVCYTGTGTTGQTYAHNLGVAPELMIVKSRTVGSAWYVYTPTTGNTNTLVLSSTAAVAVRNVWGDTSPTASVFSVGTSGAGTNNASATYVAYLFASCPGVSKVGSYTGTGTAGNTVTTGFIPRFIMIKCTTTTGSWLVLDSARGLTSGNDPSLYLNSTAAEITNTDWVTVSSTGFQLNTTGNTSNGAGETYIYLAIA